MEKERKYQGLILKVKQYLEQQKVDFDNLALIGNEIHFVIHDDESDSHWPISLKIEELQKQPNLAAFQNYMFETIENKVWEDCTVTEVIDND